MLAGVVSGEYRGSSKIKLVQQFCHGFGRFNWNFGAVEINTVADESRAPRLNDYKLSACLKLKKKITLVTNTPR